MILPPCPRHIHPVEALQDALGYQWVVRHGCVELRYDHVDVRGNNRFEQWVRQDHHDVCRALAYPEVEDFLKLVGYDILEKEMIGDYS